MYLYFTNCLRCYILLCLIFLVSVFKKKFLMVQIHVPKKRFFGKSNFLSALPLSKRPLSNNGHFPLVKVAVIERLDCTWIINRMLSGPFCIRGYHFTAKLHQIKIRLPAQINPFRFSRFVEFLIREISGT